MKSKSQDNIPYACDNWLCEKSISCKKFVGNMEEFEGEVIAYDCEEVDFENIKVD